jgi:hypothetical protein
MGWGAWVCGGRGGNTGVGRGERWILFLDFFIRAIFQGSRLIVWLAVLTSASIFPASL